MKIKKSHQIFKLKNLATFSKSDTWEKYLKPALIKIKEREALAEAEPNSEFEAIKRDIKRSNTIKITNEIISLVEKAEDKLGRNYD